MTRVVSTGILSLLVGSRTAHDAQTSADDNPQQGVSIRRLIAVGVA